MNGGKRDFYYCGGTLAERCRPLPSTPAAIGVLGLGLYGILTLKSRAATLPVAVRSSALFVLGGLPFTLLLLWYHTRAFGGPLESGYRHLADVAYRPWHEGGFLGIGLPHFRAFFLSLFSPLRGLFILSPALLLALPGMVVLFRRARSTDNLWAVSFRRRLTIMLGYFYFTFQSFSYESWGWTTGPRHLTPLVPFLLLPSALAFEAIRAPWLRTIASMACALSILTTAGITLTNYIPDDVSNALFALSLPLFRDGFVMPTAFWLVGVPSPIDAWIWVILVLVIAVSVPSLLRSKPFQTRSVLIAAAVLGGPTHSISRPIETQSMIARR